MVHRKGVHDLVWVEDSISESMMAKLKNREDMESVSEKGHFFTLGDSRPVRNKTFSKTLNFSKITC